MRTESWLRILSTQQVQCATQFTEFSFGLRMMFIEVSTIHRNGNGKQNRALKLLKKNLIKKKKKKKVIVVQKMLIANVRTSN